MEYDYDEALKRQGHKQSDVDALRTLVDKHELVPKSITNKQVRLRFFGMQICLMFLTNFIGFLALAVLGLLWQYRKRSKSLQNLLRYKEEITRTFCQPRPRKSKDSTMPTKSRLFLLAKHSEWWYCGVPSPFEFKSIWLPLWWGNKNVLHDHW